MKMRKVNSSSIGDRKYKFKTKPFSSKAMAEAVFSMFSKDPTCNSCKLTDDSVRENDERYTIEGVTTDPEFEESYSDKTFNPMIQFRIFEPIYPITDDEREGLHRTAWMFSGIQSVRKESKEITVGEGETRVFDRIIFKTKVTEDGVTFEGECALPPFIHNHNDDFNFNGMEPGREYTPEELGIE